ncbi:MULTISPECIES: CHASE2 domain-containing protein [Arthrospira]|uniref:CHASE2 domain-containing protein n=1 Tax=Limnospira platensis NIES-46 TaxID=1236695 RepID=A0A5M3T305_LIMPL|nr:MULTISPECIES: CHASE2 domain-containing protein [Arthrospira]AMW27895.1 molecular chaperone TorD [Arthrospira platensis YZ]MBD2711000.1 CHASE2 domain-containing protein [Arthrospira platensis FACHB-835]MDF2210813.1 CHASE2 domain-containing protein [Arthrospira platensis NCB002]MDT9183209.1 CHASE2 domain-containing protein [Limnospira sp. PMC 289.06]MDT9295958.1 CHASE2 domain-containing protein [Arthrospira platensis PCC 7345]BAI89588.1 hypothetical protein NIES39_D01680 [Arthrospira platens
MTSPKKPTIVVINLGYGNLLSGFPHVTALLWEPENPRPLKFTGALPPAQELDGIYRRWNLIYQALYRRPGWHPRIKIDREDITNVSQVEFSDICQQYLQVINEWLGAEKFRNIDRQLRSHLNQNDEIQLILETDDELVRRLPWHFWDFLSDYPQAEIALSAPEYQRVQKLNRRKQIRILAILGNDNGLDLAEDRQVLSEIADAETVFLVQPSRQEVDQHLWDDRGWDILFFAGHSESEENGNGGLLSINATDKIGISHLKLALKTAISRGLQLAIFNSCQGLSLAAELADLHIPQIIVMREPVSDRVAHAFLVGFIQAFSRGYSFYLAVRQARERLQGLEDKFPCASWLPIICQNPAELPIVWRQQQPPIKPAFSQGRDRTFWLSSWGIALMILIIRQLGILQGGELKLYDHLMRSRPPEPPDPRIVVVEVTGNDVQSRQEYSISDGTISQVLQQLEPHQPRAIGLTIYRDFPVPPGDAELRTQMQQQDNLFAICSFPRANEPAVRSPDVIPNNRLGFDDVLVDPDGILRRHLFFMRANSDCNTGFSLSFQLARKYLAAENIFPDNQGNQNNPLQLGEAIFNPLGNTHSGAYKNLPTGGWYVMLNYRSFPIARTLTLTQVLQGDFDPNLVKNRIVLIGFTSRVNAKFFSTPHRAGQSPSDQVPGVMVQAQMVSHILSAALDGRALIGVWVWWQEVIWVVVWSMAGSAIALYIGNSDIVMITAIVIAIAILYILCYLLLLQGTWVPLLPPALTLAIAPFLRKFLPPLR